MKSYLNNLNERERRMVFTALLVVVAYIYYALLYTPLAQGVEEKKRLLQEKVVTLAWMKKVQLQHVSTQKKQSIDNSQLLTLIANQLKNDTTLQFPYKLQQTSSGEIQLSYDKVPFNLFIEWLAKINERYYINVKQLSANKTTTPGITQIMLVISSA